jgi:hypothetical protein
VAADNDPVLFGNQPSGTVAAEVPLFPSEEPIDMDIDSAISEHIKSNDHVFPKGVTKPSRAEYNLSAVVFRSVVGEKYTRDPRAWLKQEKRFLSHYPPVNTKHKVKKTLYPKIAPAPPSSPHRRSKVLAQLPRPIRAPRPPKRTPQMKVYDSFEVSSPMVPKPPRLPTNRDDIDFQSLPDYSPPIELLPNSKCLKVDWKGQPLDLSTDPNRHLLHEAEINVASTLRLNCATYLCSKRRIFQARIEALRIGKEFRKTDAQQACKIDVNKASKLWTAYDKVGWFRKELFMQHLR